MTIEADVPVFPNNAVELIAIRAQSIDPDLFIARRPLRKTDPIQAIGIYANYWMPNENSYEMKGAPPGRHEPTLSNYMIGIEAYIKDMDEERGLAKHSVLSTMIRSLLYRDGPLLLGLRALSVSISGSTERVQRYGIRTQRYASNELQGAFMYLSTMELWIETETV